MRGNHSAGEEEQWREGGKRAQKLMERRRGGEEETVIISSLSCESHLVFQPLPEKLEMHLVHLFKVAPATTTELFFCYLHPPPPPHHQASQLPPQIIQCWGNQQRAETTRRLQGPLKESTKLAHLSQRAINLCGDPPPKSAFRRFQQHAGSQQSSRVPEAEFQL